MTGSPQQSFSKGMDTRMTDNRQTVAGAYDRLEAHEDLCSERYRAIHSTLGELKDDIKWMLRGTLAVILMVMGWGAIQLWNAGTNSASAHPVAVTASVSEHR